MIKYGLWWLKIEEYVFKSEIFWENCIVQSIVVMNQSIFFMNVWRFFEFFRWQLILAPFLSIVMQIFNFLAWQNVMTIDCALMVIDFPMFHSKYHLFDDSKLSWIPFNLYYDMYALNEQQLIKIYANELV